MITVTITPCCAVVPTAVVASPSHIQHDAVCRLTDSALATRSLGISHSNAISFTTCRRKARLAGLGLHARCMQSLLPATTHPGSRQTSACLKTCEIIASLSKQSSTKQLQSAEPWRYARTVETQRLRSAPTGMPIGRLALLISATSHSNHQPRDDIYLHAQP